MALTIRSCWSDVRDLVAVKGRTRSSKTEDVDEQVCQTEDCEDNGDADNAVDNIVAGCRFFLGTGNDDIPDDTVNEDDNGDGKEEWDEVIYYPGQILNGSGEVCRGNG